MDELSPSYIRSKMPRLIYIGRAMVRCIVYGAITCLFIFITSLTSSRDVDQIILLNQQGITWRALYKLMSEVQSTFLIETCISSVACALLAYWVSTKIIMAAKSYLTLPQADRISGLIDEKIPPDPHSAGNKFLMIKPGDAACYSVPFFLIFLFWLHHLDRVFDSLLILASILIGAWFTIGFSGILLQGYFSRRLDALIK